nr:hypothetical protein [Tanacetum cinerariifolium]
MHKAFPLPVIEFPLAEELPTASEESCHRQKKSEATAVKIALLSKVKKKLRITFNTHLTSTFHTHQEMDQQYPTVAKIPILDTGKFEQWQFQIQQYLQHEHYALWESGRTVTLTAEDMQKKKNDVKARTTLLLSLPDEHQLHFRESLSIHITFSFHTHQEMDQQYPTVAKIPILDTGKFEQWQFQIQQYLQHEHYALWEAAILKTFGGNEATKKTKKNILKQQYGNFKAEGSKTLEQTFNRLGSQIKFEDINQIDEDDMEEMDIKWNMALLSMKADKFWKKTWKKISIQGSDMAGFDKSKVECFNYHKMGHFARECIAPISQDRGRRDNYIQGSKAEDQAPKALMAIDETVATPITPKPFIKFVKPKDTQSKSKTDETETPKKPPVKYAKQYRKLNKKPNVKGNQRNWNNLKSQQLGPDFVMKKKACFNCGNISYLSEFEPFDGGYVSFGQGGCKITGKGTIKTGKLEFKNVYFVKDLKDFKLLDDANILLRAPRQHNMYSIDLNNIVPHRDLTCLVTKASADECMMWHRRLGHLNFKTMNKLFRHNLVRGLPTKCFKNDHTCTACLKGKQHKASCKSKLVNSVTTPLHTLHIDLFVPTSVSSISHKWYCLVVPDDFSRFTWTFFLKSKDETSGILKKFITKIKNLKDLKVKIIRCDNGGEFKNKEMNDFCSQKGIKREFSNARTPQQNGVAERRNITLIEAARTMLADAKLPVTFWAEAVNTACYVQNRVLVNKSHNKTPYELFNGRSTAIGFLKPFGCHVMILNTLDNLGKFEEKGMKVTLLDTQCTKDAISQEVKKNVSSLRYIALPNWAHDALLESSSSKPQDHCSTEVSEGSGNPNPTASTSIPPADPMEILTVESPIPTASSPVLTAYSTDSQEPSSDARLISKRVANQEETPSLDNILSLTNRFEDILGITTNSDESNGVEANISNMETAITAITASPTPTLRIHKDHPKNVWTLVDCPKGVRPIGTKWVLKNKKDERGIVIRNKARLVAQGHIQEERIDYDEVFAPVARIEAIRLFLAYASFMGFTVYQMNVKSSFLYGTIDEEVYVMQPPGFQDPEFPAKYIKWRKLCMDYIRLQEPSMLCREFEALMHEKFQMSTMGELNFFLGLQVLQKEDVIFLSQDKHQVKHKECHLHAVKRIFRYLKGHPKLGLWYPKESPFDLVAYSDSDYGGATQDRKSTTGGCQFLGRRLISWQCKKQTIMPTSTTKAEYVAAASCYGQCKLFPVLGKLFTVSVFLGFGLTFAGTSKYWGVLRILMIGLRLIPP